MSFGGAQVIVSDPVILTLTLPSCHHALQPVLTCNAWLKGYSPCNGACTQRREIAVPCVVARTSTAVRDVTREMTCRTMCRLMRTARDPVACDMVKKVM